MNLAADRFSAASEDAAADFLFDKRLTDGLPVVAPTPERVERMLMNSGGLDPDIIIADVPPLGGRLTVEKAAINAVMAGCPPEIFPVVLAAAAAVTDPVFDVGLISATQHCVTPLIVVNGPAREFFGVASGIGALGPGHRANATIGRAIRLILMNVGGAWPGVGDMSVLGSPAKFTCCLAEAEEESPFEPLHVSRGFAADDSVVTALGIEGMHQVVMPPLARGEADTVLKVAGATLAAPGANNIYFGIGMVGLILNPVHAQALADEGYSRRDVQARLFECAVQRRGYLRSLTKLTPEGDDDDLLHVVATPEDILVLVAGAAAGGYSAVLPSFAGGKNGQIAVSRPIRFDEGCGIYKSVRA